MDSIHINSPFGRMLDWLTINLFTLPDFLWCICSRRLLKTLLQEVKLLIMINFSICLNVFKIFSHYTCIYRDVLCVCRFVVCAKGLAIIWNQPFSNCLAASTFNVDQSQMAQQVTRIGHSYYHTNYRVYATHVDSPEGYKMCQKQSLGCIITDFIVVLTSTFQIAWGVYLQFSTSNKPIGQHWDFVTGRPWFDPQSWWSVRSAIFPSLLLV